MALKKREKILAVITGALLVTFAGVYLLRGGGDSLSDLRTQREGLQKTKDLLEIQARPGDKASVQLGRWRKRSLPTNPNVARDVYDDWLGKLAVERLRQVDITPMTPQSLGGVSAAGQPIIIHTTLPFRIEGRGTLDQLTRFLFDFESTGYLHKVRQLNADPIRGSRDLKLTITVEALCLPGAAHQDKLPVGLRSRLESSKLDEYLQAIVRRQMEGDYYVDAGGLFAAYAPKPPVRVERTQRVEEPPQPPPKPEFDPSAHTYVSSIRTEAGVPKVWFYVRTEGRTLKLHEGDPFEVGTMRGTIARIRIDELDVEIKLDGGQRQLVAFGDNLHQGVEPPD